MQIIKYPHKTQWNDLLKRPLFDISSLHDTVWTVLKDVQNNGDEAVKKYEEKFDKVKLSSLIVTDQEIDRSTKQVPQELQNAIIKAADNIYKFHAGQKIETKKIETTQGVYCWQKSVGIEKVGLYIPGGTAPLFSTVLMLAIPANIAGCKEIVLCTPPDKDGNINPAILFAAKIAKVNQIFKIGGIQAIGAMAYGTQSVPQVYKIYGPGNQYVMAAKQLVSLKDVAIDMPAGPSEVLVIADDKANPKFVAADLLSQAEHGVDSQVILVSTSETMINLVNQEVDRQLTQLTRKDIAEQALKHSKAILLQNEDEIVELTNEYAPEHLIIQTQNYDQIASQIVNAGSVFLGSYTPESAGDYASGTNHTLPTNGYAKAYSGVNLDSFVKKITFQEITQKGIQHLGSTIEIMADHEQLTAHKNAVTLRLNNK